MKLWSLYRWRDAHDWGMELKCDGNEVVVGSCSGGGGLGSKDCAGECFVTTL